MRKRSRRRHSQISGTALLHSWGPPIVWMAAISWFSTDTFSADHTGAVLEPLFRWLLPAIRPSQIAAAHYLVRKGAPLTAYAILAALVLYALSWRERSGWTAQRAAGALAAVGACALLDEWHQSFTLHRTGSLRDSLIDIMGAAAALFLLSLQDNRRAPKQEA